MAIIRRSVVKTDTGVEALKVEYPIWDEISGDTTVNAVYNKIKEVFLFDCEAGSKSMLVVHDIWPTGEFPICVSFNDFTVKEMCDDCGTLEGKKQFIKENMSIIIEAILDVFPMIGVYIKDELSADLENIS